jgi:glutaminyl-tRNA synthetase
VKGTLHWVSASHAVDAVVRLYDNLFMKENPGDDSGGPDFTAHINPASLEVLRGCKAEPGLAAAGPGDMFQFLRHGYFCADIVDSKPGSPVFNRTASLRDTWAKIEKTQSGKR